MSEYKKLEIPIVEGEHPINIVATYDGILDGVITLSSGFSQNLANEGLDIEIKLQLQDVDNTIQIPITVVQEGRRELFITSDGRQFSVDNETFNVLKHEL